MRDRPPSRTQAAGFTLPAIMVVAAALLILAVGLMAVISIERKTARSFADAKRAELAARAGLEDFRASLRTETANDDYLIIGGTPEVEPTEGHELPASLFIARGSGGEDDVSYRYIPLFSSNELPATSGTLEAPEIAIGSEEDDDSDGKFATIAGPPWLDSPQAEWVPVEDENGDVVARYAYWVEDLQGKIDATTAGNNEGPDGGNARNEYPFPASGINPEPPADDELKLDQVAIHVLDPMAPRDGDGKLVQKIVNGRPAMVSPESIVAATGHEAPLVRDEYGLLEDPVAAALEKSASPVIRHYEEQPTVPYAAGISEEYAGQPKLNLNALLEKPRATAVDEFANWVGNALPDFEQRKGGFPDDYLRTLAANAFDYADTDNDPTLSDDNYRGVDGYPLVSEFLMSFHWDSVLREDGRLFVVITVSTFVELWNMTNQPVEGEGQVSFETKFDFVSGANPGIVFEEQAEDPEVATPVATKEDGYLWHQPFQVTLKPDEYQVYPSRIQLKIDVGPASGFVQSPIQIYSNQQDQHSGYHFRWNKQIVDQSRSQTWKAGGTIYYPDDTKSKSRQFVRATIPAHSHSTAGGNSGPFQNNMGDPRMAFYLGTPQAANAYPNNYSPHRRNIRWENVYRSDLAAKPKVYGRVLPSEWPDIGHDSPYGTRPSLSADDQRIDPVDPSFLSGRPTPVAEQAPMRLSNLGRFYSAMELGKVYDPIMWQPAYDKIFDTSSIRGGTMPTSQTSWPGVNTFSVASQSYGGGNTLRIGRAEHPRFEVPGWHAAHLLDLFHAGESTSLDAAEREGNLVEIAGNVNLNTASADAIRALAAGTLKQDPLLCFAPSKSHQTTSLMAAPTQPLELGAPTDSKFADHVAEAILRSRPFACAADIASARDKNDEPVFGNRDMYSQGNKIHWTDSAAEEVFGRVYEASTLRSRNFRVWVIGQALAPPPRGSNADPEILSESKKAFTVFADPGERNDDGTINPSTYRPRVIHENDF
ncbi:type IV pilus modification PilV family protein [Luteolibacter marinus]|uniref:type IV pilus modification PilV family protein n=1 Tax=Luteolibacter marinus TaxID=2776705 RepID=UPI00186641F4|nr:hypothetical protein [Luteolibacter marinus]